MNTPGIYYAISYWMSAGVWLLLCRRRFLVACTVMWWAVIGAFLSAVMIASDGTKQLFIPLMFLYVGLLIVLCKGLANIDWNRAVYGGLCIFIIGEFCASFVWLCVFLFQTYIWKKNLPFFFSVAVAAVLYVIFYCAVYGGGRRLKGGTGAGACGKTHLTGRELFSVILITISTFTVSNLSYIVGGTMAIGGVREVVFYVRTVVDMAGCAVLYAYHVQRGELEAKLEVEKLSAVLDMQYQNYEMLNSAMEIVNRKYHDLKYHINILKEGALSGDLRGILQIEEEIKSYEAQNKTGHKIIDTILTAKALYCQNNWIELTAVVDGETLSFMSDIDVSSLFGNMIDNAIEGVMRVLDKEKRMIHLAVSRRNHFLCIRIENEFVPDLIFVDGVPQTSKKSSANHGFGIKSMQETVRKYGGSLRIQMEGTKFSLGILIPLPQTVQ